MKRVVYKKSVLVLALTALLFLALALFGLGGNTIDKAYAAQSDYVLDANQLAIDGNPAAIAKKDTANNLGDGADNLIIETGVSKAAPSVKIKASGYSDAIYGGDNDALRVEVKLLFNRWQDLGYGGFSSDATYISLKIYNSTDTKFENPLACSVQYGRQEENGAIEQDKVMGNFIRTFQLAPEKVCNYRGKLTDFVVRVESDASSWSSAIIIDYVKIVFTQKSELMGGETIVGVNPENVADENVIWTEAEGYAGTYIDPLNYGGFYAYVDSAAMVKLKKENFPSVECQADENGANALLLKNAVFALNVGKIAPEDYQQFIMDILLTDKRAKGNHTLYLYGGNPEKFVDESGNPVNYATMVTVESYEQGYHNKFV